MKEVKKGWANALSIATEAIDMCAGVIPHILKHTAITWAMQNGASREDAASLFSATIQTFETTYWHHPTYFQRSVVDAIDNRRNVR
ncbi:hypothetical protein DL239_21140 [Sedimentitalea sp. CY04]|uniref:Uncharacterized protein n=1 Tax=Parasedimentitalea denitrificans TaxID=2211118 RepID=A0ABX0WDB7_9RHOB|nr:hypothetical protein [Sedimentitalea sp. CY04]NIZ63471.1 hypothetical protein [Sedimentitalea sp. CY04]